MTDVTGDVLKVLAAVDPERRDHRAAAIVRAERLGGTSRPGGLLDDLGDGLAQDESIGRGCEDKVEFIAAVGMRIPSRRRCLLLALAFAVTAQERDDRR